MVLCVGVCLILLLGMAVLRKQAFWQYIRSPCRILFIFGLFGILAEVLSGVSSEGIASGLVKRNPPNEGELETEASVCLEKEKITYPVTLLIPERKYKPSGELERIQAAIDEIQDTFCGSNASLNEIVSNPNVSGSYQNGEVLAEWLFSDEEVISAEGTIFQEALGQEKEEIEAFVALSCGESEDIYRFSFQIQPLAKSREEAVLCEIKKQIGLQDETNPYVELPNEIDGQKATWQEVSSYQSIEILLLGILAAFASAYAAKEQREKQLQKRKRNMLLSYPEFVSKLSLLLGAGMTIPGGLRKMNQMYQRRKQAGGKEELVYEELNQMICELENGIGELRAYQRFSEKCDLQPYRKLVSLLVSGQRMGNCKLMEQLNEEADRVFLERKNAARKFGEEAGTKMLIPMMLMLFIVMAIVIIPAFLSIRVF